MKYYNIEMRKYKKTNLILKIIFSIKKLILSSIKIIIGFFPFFWGILLFIIPFLLILKISLSINSRSIPPYSSLVIWKDQTFSLFLNLKNYIHFLEDSLYFQSYIQSIKIAILSTLICLIISYPISWIISQTSNSWKNFFIFLIIIPSWIPFLIRLYSLMGFLDDNGTLNHFLISYNIIESPIRILYTNTAMYIGIVYCYLPFMLLPIYSEMKNLDYSLIEAALDLGLHPIKILFKVLLPLTKKGIISGCILVFIPSLGEYMIPELLGGSTPIMIGSIIWKEFFSNHDWPMASAMSLSMIFILIIPLIWMYKSQYKK